MIILITGASHTGKTVFAQKLLEKYNIPYLSIDHLKMGLIRSKMTELSPLSADADLTQLLWPILCGMIKTAIENHQNLIVEGCYIPHDWEKAFSAAYLDQIRLYCLVMSERYIRRHFDEIQKHASEIEKRLDDSGYTAETALRDNESYLDFAQGDHAFRILIDDGYQLDLDLFNESIIDA